MKKSLLIILTLLVMGVMSPSSAQSQADSVRNHSLIQNPEVDAAIKVLDAWIKATIRNREQPGLSIGIVYDQDLIWSKGYGFADIANQVPATPSTLYRIASISKLFTTTGIMQLRDAGKLQLDDPVVKYLPWFKLTNLYPEGPTVTIRHLLTHTSGLPREAKGVNWNDLTFPTRQNMIKNLTDQNTVFPAETVWKYSNLGLSLAGEIVADVSGESWPDYIMRHILMPLSMTSTVPLPDKDMSNLAVGYGRRVSGMSRSIEPFVDIEAERPAGNIASSVEDLAKFISLQFYNGKLTGAQILKNSTLNEMHRIHWLLSDWQSGWGLGFAIRRVGDETRVGHGGSLPGYRTLIEMVPEKKLGVIVLTNSDDGNPLLYINKTFEVVGPAITEATEPPRVKSEFDTEWGRYVGTYTWKNSEIEINILNGKLIMIVPEDDNPWVSRVTLEPISKYSFKAIPAQWHYSLNGEILTFELDPMGNIKRFGSPNFYWIRK